MIDDAAGTEFGNGQEAGSINKLVLGRAAAEPAAMVPASLDEQAVMVPERDPNEPEPSVEAVQVTSACQWQC